MTEYSKEPSFKETGLVSVITEFALALTAFRGETWQPSGTAIVIGPYFAITAKHVIEGYWNRYEKAQLKAKIGETVEAAGTFHILAFQVLERGRTGALWSVTRLWGSPFTDVAFLRLTPWSEEARRHQWRTAKMNLLPPKVGTRVSGFGYHSSAISHTQLEDRIEVEWKDSPTTTIGEVIEIHERRRDESMLNFPCFRINAKTVGGMSGGPIFNEQGQLCGIICSGLTEGDGDTEHISYVASLWPSMGTEIDMERKGFPTGIRYPVLELAEHGYIKAENWERIIILKKADGTPQVRLKV
jgi:V8-like Glu-specific endopeptidase